MSQITHNTLQQQIDHYTRDILNATEKSWEALKNKDRKQNVFWLDEKKKLTEERTALQKKLQQTPSQETTIRPKTRQEIKDKIISLNALAKEADRNMRLALRNKQLSQANDFLRERNQFNAEVKHLNKLLNPPEIKEEVSAPSSKKENALSREEIKAKIRDFHAKALLADRKMRGALGNRELEKANELLQQRNYLNSEAKKLAILLSPPNIMAKSTKATQHIESKQAEAVAKPQATLSREALKSKIRELNSKALQADKDMRIALSEKRLIKANGLLQQRNQFNAEAREQLKQLQAPIEKPIAVVQKSPKKKALSREEIKVKIKQANQSALKANASIRASLKAKEYQKANGFLKQRKKFTAEAKALTLLLNPPKTAKIPVDPIQPHITKQTDKTLPNNSTPQIQTTAPIEPTSISFETKIAHQYVTYRLDFVHFFYKRKELQAQIKKEQKNICDSTDKTVTALKIELQTLLKSPPPTFIEDHAHNDIILHLLEKTDERGIPLFSFPEITKKTMGSPLASLNNQQDFNDFIYRYTEEGSDNEAGKRVLLRYFIRDIIQVKSPLTISDLILNDAIMDTAKVEYGFVQQFDEIVARTNNEISRLHAESEDTLMPTILRPIGKFANLGHRDAIQLIPPFQKGVDQFAGAILEDVTIQDNVISSTAKLQGIFSTDGAFRNLQIINNKIVTAGEHKICILGMLSGEVTGNTNLEKSDLNVKIQPLRLGGGTPITNYFVLDFSPDCSYQYEHIEGVSGTNIDRRRKKVIPGNKGYDPRKYLLNFDMDYFTQQYQDHDKPQGRFKAIHEIIEKMIYNEKAVKANSAALDALEHGFSQEEAIAIQTVKSNKTKMDDCDPIIQKNPIK